MDQSNLRYDHLIKNHLEHLKRRYQDLLVDADALPQFWFLTTTFLPVEIKRDDHIPIPPHRCIVFFERFYVRLLSRLMNNFQRKGQRPLQSLTYLYIDYPFTKREKTHAALSPIERFFANPFHFYPEHPETTCHIHSVMLVAPQLVDRFKAIRPSLATLFQSLGTANCTLHTAPLQTHDDLRRAMFYSSKLLREMSKKLREPWKLSCEPWKSLSDIDLYSVLPKAKSEPVYAKSQWERELEAALKESQLKAVRTPQLV